MNQYKKHISSFDIVMMKRDGMSNAKIAEMTGRPESVIADILKSYDKQAKIYAGASFGKNVTAKKRHSNNPMHPERNSQYKEPS